MLKYCNDLILGDLFRKIIKNHQKSDLQFRNDLWVSTVKYLLSGELRIVLNHMNFIIQMKKLENIRICFRFERDPEMDLKVLKIKTKFSKFQKKC